MPKHHPLPWTCDESRHVPLFAGTPDYLTVESADGGIVCLVPIYGKMDEAMQNAVERARHIVESCNTERMPDAF